MVGMAGVAGMAGMMVGMVGMVGMGLCRVGLACLLARRPSAVRW